MALVLKEFGYEETLLAGDLNDMNDNIRAAIDEVALIRAFTSGTTFGVIHKGVEEAASVFIFNADTDNIINFSQPIRQEEQTPEASPDFGDWNIGDYLYIGNEIPFNAAEFILTVPGGAFSILPIFEYWNAATEAWTSMAAVTTDGTSGLTSNGTISWTLVSLTNWGAASLQNIKEGGNFQHTEFKKRYWIRIGVGVIGSPTGQTIRKIIIDSPTGRPLSRDLLVRSHSPDSEQPDIKGAPVDELSVIVEPGAAIVDSRLVVNLSNLAIPIDPPDPSNPGFSHYVYVVIRDDGAIIPVYGTAAASPVRPVVPPNVVHLAEILVTVGDTEIETGDIDDQRFFEVR